MPTRRNWSAITKVLKEFPKRPKAMPVPQALLIFKRSLDRSCALCNRRSWNAPSSKMKAILCFTTMNEDSPRVCWIWALDALHYCSKEVKRHKSMYIHAFLCRYTCRTFQKAVVNTVPISGCSVYSKVSTSLNRRLCCK